MSGSDPQLVRHGVDFCFLGLRFGRQVGLKIVRFL
jgi:hypothetical protein